MASVLVHLIHSTCTLHLTSCINHPAPSTLYLAPCTHRLWQAVDWELWSLLLPNTKRASECSSGAWEVVQSQSSTGCHPSHPKPRIPSQIPKLQRLLIAISSSWVTGLDPWVEEHHLTQTESNVGLNVSVSVTPSAESPPGEVEAL